MEAYLISMCTEYDELVQAMVSGSYSRAELYTIESQRQVLHDQILQHLNKTRYDVPDMHKYVIGILMIAKGNNIQ